MLSVSLDSRVGNITDVPFSCGQGILGSMTAHGSVPDKKLFFFGLQVPDFIPPGKGGGGVGWRVTAGGQGLEVDVAPGGGGGGYFAQAGGGGGKYDDPPQMKKTPSCFSDHSSFPSSDHKKKRKSDKNCN